MTNKLYALAIAAGLLAGGTLAASAAVPNDSQGTGSATPNSPAYSSPYAAVPKGPKPTPNYQTSQGNGQPATLTPHVDNGNPASQGGGSGDGGGAGGGGGGGAGGGAGGR